MTCQDKPATARSSRYDINFTSFLKDSILRILSRVPRVVLEVPPVVTNVNKAERSNEKQQALPHCYHLDGA